MSDRFFSRQQQAMATWLLLAIIILLLGSIILLRLAPVSSPAPPVASTAAGQEPAEPIVRPGSEEGLISDSLILALQVGLGAGLTGYIIGYKRGELKATRRHKT